MKVAIYTKIHDFISTNYFLIFRKSKLKLELEKRKYT